MKLTGSGGSRSFLHVAAFVTVWMCCGWLFHLGAETYLVFGIPLVVLFQTIVRRQPLRALWVRDSDGFRLRPVGVLAAVALMLIPACALFVSVPQHNWAQSAYLAAACGGAVGAGFALQQVPLALSSRALRPFVVATVLGILSMAIGALWESRSPWLPVSKLPSLLLNFFIYIPVCFALEEVVFRGALDTHVWQPDGTRLQSWVSALFVSCLWGLWHLPLLPDQTQLSLLAAAPVVILVHALDGAFIAFSWRASGSLILPAIYHSLIDAYRDTLHT